ncbi:MAG: Beta-lactamase [Tardiphaga sp.]|nr:Beta-lactamase [Tardiphaga sp.]
MNKNSAPRGDIDLHTTASSSPTDRSDGIDAIINSYAGRQMPNLHLETFRQPGTTFATRTIRAGAPVRPLNYASRPLPEFAIPSGGAVYDIYDYVARNRIAGLLVMHNDQVLLEHYDLGLTAATKWLSMSMAKSVATTLVGAAVQDGLIDSIDDPLTKYLPQLAGSAYEVVSIKALMQMTSGVQWDDTQTNPDSERRHMLQLQIDQQPGAIIEYMASRPRVAAPGTVSKYSTGDTQLVGALVRAATGKWLSDYLSEKIWSKLGMEADAEWWLEARDGLEVAGSGLFATMRDYARFGRFILADGVIDGERVLPVGWMRDAAASRQIGGARVDYGYMWWPVPAPDGSLDDGAFSARGIFGQFIYINPKHNIISVVLSARSKPKFSESILDNDFWNAAVAALR